jgi:hypothetical protein
MNPARLRVVKESPQCRSEACAMTVKLERNCVFA